VVGEAAGWSVPMDAEVGAGTNVADGAGAAAASAIA
jgi:hypothetical protein